MERDNSQFECVLSGLRPTEAEAAVVDHPLNDDDLGDLPVGWFEVRVRRRVPNERWLMIQAVKAELVKNQLANVPEDRRDDALPVVALSIDAGYAALEATTPPYLVVEDVVYLASEAREPDAPGLTAALRELGEELQLQALGGGTLVAEFDDDGADDDDDDKNAA